MCVDVVAHVELVVAWNLRPNKWHFEINNMLLSATALAAGGFMAFEFGIPMRTNPK